MRLTIPSLIAVLAATARGISISSPSNGQCVDLINDLQVKWTAVDTDPKEISFSLVNYRGANPPVDMPLSFVAMTSQLSYLLPGFGHDIAANMSNMNGGVGFQINIVRPGSSTGAAPLAQSGTFKISRPGHPC